MLVFTQSKSAPAPPLGPVMALDPPIGTDALVLSSLGLCLAAVQGVQLTVCFGHSAVVLLNANPNSRRQLKGYKDLLDMVNKPNVRHLVSLKVL